MLFYYLFIVIIFTAFRLAASIFMFFYLFGRRRETLALRACCYRNLSYGLLLDNGGLQLG